MRIGVLKERRMEEARIAVSSETVKKITALGAEVVVEKGAGVASDISDDALLAAGAKIEADPTKILQSSDIILKVQPPFEKVDDKVDEYSLMKKGAVLVSMLNPYENRKKIEDLAKNQINAFCLEFIPRITRAQSMDVLSSQSNLAGYKAVLDAVSEIGKVVPMMTTAAGTISPAKVLILGAGVAGLQAVATAKRLGAVVSVFDVRPAVKEQVQSLGATFIEVPSEEVVSAETKGGYAKEMSKEYQEKQKQLIHDTIKKQDIVITTALIPGKPAPILITKQMVNDMRPGSVIVDLAATAGGNCEYTQRGKVIKQNGVTIIGHENVPSRVAADASQLYARNLFNLLALIIDKESKLLKIDLKDEIIKGALVTYNGQVIHPALVDQPMEKGEVVNRDSANPPQKVLDDNPHLKNQIADVAPKIKEGTEING